MNTRLITLVLILLTISFSGVSQEDYYGENLNSSLYSASQIIGNSAPQSPDVAAFQKVNFVPVSNYTGRANITVPIYTISVGSMSVPISLSYNSSGVKVSDMASNLGLNWSLNAGGMISKITKGMDDFFPLWDRSGSSGNDMASAGWLSYTNASSYSAINPYNDAQPDVFVANAPGLSTKYVFKNPYGTNLSGHTTVYASLPDPVELEHQGNLIDVTSIINSTGGCQGLIGFGNTDITSLNGIKYSFGTEETSKNYNAFKSKYSISSGPFRTTVSGYKLDKIYDSSTNQSIDFEYEEYIVDFYDDIEQYGGDYNGGTGITKYTHTSGHSRTIYPKLNRLKKIIFDKGSVEFIYGLDRLDNPDEKAITEIKVKDNDGNTIKHVKMDYSYFQSSIESSTPQSKRLRLDKVYEVDPLNTSNILPGHEFAYNTTYTMPPRGSYAHDFLGYNNGSYNSSISNPLPKLYIDYYNSTFTKYIKITPFYDANDVEISGNFSLEANANYAKTYALEKITFPTGGYNEYELNSFYYNNATRSGGGIRVKSQKLNDGKGNEQILDYEYDTGYVSNFPVFSFLEGDLPANGLTFSQMNIGITTFLSPQSQVEFTQGAFVGYRKVTVKDRINNGYKEYYYSSNGTTSYKNLEPTITFDNSHGVSSNWAIIKPPSLILDRDFLRGKILKEYVYNVDGDVRLEKEYTYTQKEFSTIPLKYLNKSSSNPNYQCYNSNGNNEYLLGYGVNNYCGGYYEEVDLPVARDLLTSVVTKDYQAGSIVYTQGGSENYPYTFETTQQYTYDKQFPLVLNESKKVTTCEELYQQGQDCTTLYDLHEQSMSKTTTYPITGGNTMQSNTFSTMPLANDLANLNRLATPLTITSSNQNSEEHYYKNFGNNIIALEKIDFISRDANITNSEIITKRDAKGHILEYQKRNDTYVSMIYGYDNTLLIAQVENATYASIETISDFGTNFSITSNLSNAQEVSLRNLSNTMVTTYTYAPLIGVTIITDPKGYTTTYEYDAFNRLKRVKDASNKILSENKYHFKNQ